MQRVSNKIARMCHCKLWDYLASDRYVVARKETSVNHVSRSSKAFHIIQTAVAV